MTTITPELKRQLINDLTSQDIYVASEINESEYPAAIDPNDGTLWMQVFVGSISEDCSSLCTEVSFENRKGLLEYADDNLDYQINVNAMFEELSHYITDTNFRNELIDALTQPDGSDAFYAALKEMGQDTDGNTSIITYEEDDFFNLLCGNVNVETLKFGGDHFAMRRALVESSLPTVVSDFEELLESEEEPLVDADFFNASFNLAQKYRLVEDLSRFAIKTGYDGKISFIEAEEMKPDEYYDFMSISSCDGEYFEKAFCVAKLEIPWGSTCVKIELIHPENQRKYENYNNCTLFAQNMHLAIEWLNELYEESATFISVFDKARAKGQSMRWIAEGLVEHYNLLVDGSVYDRLNVQFEQDEDGDWKFSDYEYQTGAYVTDNIRLEIGELVSPLL